MKFKKIILSVITLCLLFITTGCNQEEFTVTFDSDGGTFVEEQVVEKNDYATKPTNPTKEGYNFLYWELGNAEYDFGTEVTKDITLVAKYEENSGSSGISYLVTFNSASGSDVASQTIATGSKITKPANPTKEGYKFLYWELENKEYDFETVVTKDITLVAKWLETYTVTFNVEGGSKVSSQTIDSGLKATKPSTPTKSGYTFLGWYLNNVEYDFKSGVTKNITLVAKWEPTVSVTKYTVTFNSSGGSTVASQSIPNGSKATKPTNPTRSGYTFKGWYLDDIEYNFNSTISKNITLVARWDVVVVPDVYTISQENYEIGSPQVIVIVKKNGTKITASQVLNSSGTILGEYSSEAGNILVDKSEYSRIAKVKLTNGTIVNIQ